MTGAGGAAILRRARTFLLAALLALGFAPVPSVAQQAQTGGTTVETPATPPTVTPAPTGTPTSTTVVVSKGAGKSAGPDYAAWERLAARAETLLSNPDTEARGLELLRSQLAAERAKFLAAQNTNSTRIATVREQIAALGPPRPRARPRPKRSRSAASNWPINWCACKPPA